MSRHSTLTDPAIHETKGAATATAGYILTATGTGATFQTAAVTPSGGVAKSLMWISTASATATALIPFDNTIPTSGEGFQVMTTTWTPLAINNKIRIAVQSMVSSSTAAHVSLGLFQDANTAALSANAVKIGTAGDVQNVGLIYEYVATATASTTLSVRAGASAAATTTFNGSLGTQLFGGVANSYIHITELKA